MQFARLALCAVLAGLCTPVVADDGSGRAYVVSRPGSGLHAPGDAVPRGKRWFNIVPDLTGVEMSLPHIRPDHRLDRYRPVRVDRKLPYQAELLLANCTAHYIPLYVDYRSQARPWDGGIDEDHSIVRAQRLMIGLTTGRPARVVRNPMMDASDDPMAGDRIQPRAVIHVPDALRRLREMKPPKKAPEKKKPNQVALAD